MVLLEGDGAFLKHIQEFEGVQRQGLKLLLTTWTAERLGLVVLKR